MKKFKECKELPDYSGIYGIRNVVTDKFYIGSAESIIKRIKRHYHYLKKCKHHSAKLQHSWNKHGEDSFEIIIIQEFQNGIDRNELLKIEEECIRKYNSVENGYNMTSICLNYIHFTQSEEAIKNFKKARGKPVVSVNRFSGDFEKEFNTIAEAAEYYEMSTSNISQVCKHKANYLKDFVFLYKEEYDSNKNYKVEHWAKGKEKSEEWKEKASKNNAKAKIIYKYDKNYDLIETFHSRSYCEKQEGFKKEGLRYKLDKLLENGFIYTHNEKLKI